MDKKQCSTCRHTTWLENINGCERSVECNENRKLWEKELRFRISVTSHYRSIRIITKKVITNKYEIGGRGIPRIPVEISTIIENLKNGVWKIYLSDDKFEETFIREAVIQRLEKEVFLESESKFLKRINSLKDGKEGVYSEKIEPQRIEIPITILKDREFSNYKPNVAWKFDFKDEHGNEYEWNTTTNPENIMKGQKWLVRMTIFAENECMGDKYKLVERVKFIKQL